MQQRIGAHVAETIRIGTCTDSKGIQHQQ